jgi:hypothetical protein
MSDNDVGPIEIFRVNGTVELHCRHVKKYETNRSSVYGSSGRVWTREYELRVDGKLAAELDEKTLQELLRWLAQRHDGIRAIAAQAVRTYAESLPREAQDPFPNEVQQ